MINVYNNNENLRIQESNKDAITGSFDEELMKNKFMISRFSRMANI